MSKSSRAPAGLVRRREVVRRGRVCGHPRASLPWREKQPGRSRSLPTMTRSTHARTHAAPNDSYVGCVRSMLPVCFPVAANGLVHYNSPWRAFTPHRVDRALDGWLAFNARAPWTQLPHQACPNSNMPAPSVTLPRSLPRSLAAFATDPSKAHARCRPERNFIHGGAW